MQTGSANLTRKAVYGIAKLGFWLGVLLFVPAWSLDFWQAWIFALFFLASSSLVTVYLLKRDPKLIERRLKAGPAAEKERSQKIIQALASVFFIALIAAPGLDRRFHGSTVPPFLVVVADVIVALGFLIVFLVFRENSFASAVIEISPGQSVVSTGPYRLVRHPMYSGALLMILFIPLALGSYRSLLLVPPIYAVILWRLLDEERFLSKNLPGYDEYRRRTRYRLAPGIR